MTPTNPDPSDGAPEEVAPGSPPSDTYQRIKQDIVLGELPPGSPLVELPLAKRYAVSRTPVREALRRLHQDGLVERFDRTMRVRQHTAQEIFELYEVRMILESAATRTAAQRRTEFDISQITHFLERMQDTNLDLATRVRTNRNFHTALWHASHNNMLVDTLERLYTNSVRYLNTTLAGNERWHQSLEEHRQIVDAVVRGDSQQAERVIINHLSEARDIRIGHIPDA